MNSLDPFKVLRVTRKNNINKMYKKIFRYATALISEMCITMEKTYSLGADKVYKQCTIYNTFQIYMHYSIRINYIYCNIFLRIHIETLIKKKSCSIRINWCHLIYYLKYYLLNVHSNIIL